MKAPPATDATLRADERPTASSSWRRTVPHASGASVNAGEQIERGKHVVGSQRRGTAGLIVRRTSAPQGRLVLTCAHVLGASAVGEEQQLAEANAVYSPEFSRCCGVDCNRPIGQVVNETLNETLEHVVQGKVEIDGRAFAVDAALIELDANTQAANEVPRIGTIADVRDLIQEWSLGSSETLTLAPERQILVQKYGATTGHTHGTLTRLKLETVKELVGDESVESEAVVFEIDAALEPGEPAREEYPLDMDRFFLSRGISTAQEVANLFSGTAVSASVGGSEDEPTLILEGQTFSRGGDSGAPILDSERRIVGILRSGTVENIFVKGEEFPVHVRVGLAQGVFIGAAFQKLQVEIVPPGQPTAGAAMTPGRAIHRGGRNVINRRALDRLRHELETTPQGARLAPVIRRHVDEVRDLIHHRRRVTVTWHRAKGPAFVAALLRALREPDRVAPLEIDGVRLVDLVRSMRDVLVAEGGPSLRASIAAHERELNELASHLGSIDDLLRIWRPARARHRSSVVAAGARPATPRGLRIANARGVPGTAGPLVRDAAGASFLLGSHHVVFGDGAGEGAPVWALAPADAGAGRAPETIAVGRARSGRIGRVSFTGQVYFVDCALIELVDDGSLPEWLQRAVADTSSPAVAKPQPGMAVVKHGATTGTTEGVIVDVAYPDYPVIEDRAWAAPGQILVDARDGDLNFSAAGDSGAALLDDRGRVVGLLWGSNTSGQGVACPIAPVLDCLGVQLAGAANTIDREARSAF